MFQATLVYSLKRGKHRQGQVWLEHTHTDRMAFLALTSFSGVQKLDIPESNCATQTSKHSLCRRGRQTRMGNKIHTAQRSQPRRGLAHRLQGELSPDLNSGDTAEKKR